MLGFNQHLVNHAVVGGFLSSHPIIAVAVALHFVQRLTGMIGNDGVEFILVSASRSLVP